MTGCENGNIFVQFKDTGCGIGTENLKRIFDPFFTTKSDGTGLGLSACYGILKAHGGDLIYSSKPGTGTTATVLLPLISDSN
jgi:signal transduction histidine kinase